MNTNKHCEQFQIEYPGKSISFILNKDELERLYVDGKNWITIYKCKICGQLWKEFYSETGHGEIPNLKK
jgi:hypothetical protein